MLIVRITVFTILNSEIIIFYKSARAKREIDISTKKTCFYKKFNKNKNNFTFIYKNRHSFILYKVSDNFKITK